MTTFDRVKKLAENQKMSIVELEERLGFGRNSLYSWKKKTPNGESLRKVADYFNVSTDYLLGRTEDKYSHLRLEDDDFIREAQKSPHAQKFIEELTDADQEALDQLEKLWRALNG
ncbi:putative repressor protein [Listeria floridensis FSL S10-1187]|uniref:Repressor protein n=1 Tax=Listeria floridensis FSL S10-1187 TaxID=1265817 RepID=A0ABP3AWH2_9LIST|nr:helix-turn-helix transcriptional regulator [Listeria floridensis]EUJ25788.1 putative repressor protein [Listeria floridensis FSL S10-1187]